MKVFKRLDIQVSAQDFDNICIVSPGVVERLLKLIQDKVSNLKRVDDPIVYIVIFLDGLMY